MRKILLMIAGYLMAAVVLLTALSFGFDFEAAASFVIVHALMLSAVLIIAFMIVWVLKKWRGRQ